jgi:hypothetical protein
MRNASKIGFVLTLAALLALVPQPVYAYTDPGSGTLIYQVVYAAFLAGTFYFRRLLDRVFGRRK